MRSGLISTAGLAFAASVNGCSVGAASASQLKDFIGLWTRNDADCRAFDREDSASGVEFVLIERDYFNWVSDDDSKYQWCSFTKAKLFDRTIVIEGECEDGRGRARRSPIVFTQDGSRLVSKETGDGYQLCLDSAGLAEHECRIQSTGWAETIELNLEGVLNGLDSETPWTECNIYRAYVDSIRYGYENLTALKCDPSRYDLAGLREMLAQHEPIEEEFCTPGEEKRLPF